MPSGTPDLPRGEETVDETPSASPTLAMRDGSLLARRPTAIGLARLSPRRVFPPGGTALYRHVARLAELGPEQEFLVVPCGRGVTAQFLAEVSKATGSGVDPNPELTKAATARARAANLSGRLHFEDGSLIDLPYQDEVFDVSIGEIGLAAVEDPAKAVRELVRVTKPMGTVLLLQLTWNTSVEPERHDVLVESLGVRPHLLVEWKQMLRDAGAVDLYVEDWSDAMSLLREPWSLGGLAEFDSVFDRAAVLVRAWQRWGWGEVKRMLQGVRTLAVPERLLGLTLIRATRWAREEEGPAEAPATDDTTDSSGG